MPNLYGLENEDLYVLRDLLRKEVERVEGERGMPFDEPESPRKARARKLLDRLNTEILHFGQGR